MKDRSIYKRALALAVPMMIQNGITNMVGLIDNVMVGSLQTEAMTAVSIVGQLMFVFNLAVFGGMSGPGIYGAQYFGQKNTEGFRSVFRMKIWTGLVCVLGGLSVFIFGSELLIGSYLRGESGSVDPVLTMNYAKEYLAIMLVGIPFFVITQIYATSLRESGESVIPMTGGVISVAVDILFNYLLIFGNLGFPELGVKGAALATVLARIVECLIIIICATVRRKRFTFLQGVYHTLKVPGTVAVQIIKKGLPLFLNEFLWSGGIAALTQCYSTLSLDIVAGLNISNILCNLLNVVFVALGSAVGIVIGQLLGASEYDRARKSSFGLMWFTGGISAVLAVILIAVSGLFPLLYDTTDLIRSYGQNFIIITALFFPVQGFLNALYFTLRSGGKTLVTFLFDSVFTWVVAIPLAALLCAFSALPVFAIYAIVQAVDIIKAAIGCVLIKKGVWISNLVGYSGQTET
ncbi:MAG: MATE family efflux transporter [Oscillospiraceae bacterium]